MYLSRLRLLLLQDTCVSAKITISKYWKNTDITVQSRQMCSEDTHYEAE